jgi:hypothetical protein
MYTTIYVYDFPSRSSKLSSRSLRLGNKELLHTTQLQTALYTKVSGTMRSLAGRCYYSSLKRSIDQHCWRLYTFQQFGRAGSGPDFDADQPQSQSRSVYLVRLISIWYCNWFMLFMTLDMPDEGTR